MQFFRFATSTATSKMPFLGCQINNYIYFLILTSMSFCLHLVFNSSKFILNRLILKRLMCAVPPSFLHRENTLFSDLFENLEYLLKTREAERDRQQLKDEIERLKQLPKDNSLRLIAKIWGLVD